MTKDELDAIRQRLAAAKAWKPFDGSWDDIAFGQRAAQDVEALLAEVDRLQLEACHHLAALGTAEILKSTWQRQKDQTRSALEGVVAACRFDCTPESNCGICAIALKALAEVGE